MIPYSITVFKNSPLATVIGILGTIGWIAGAALLINSEFVLGLTCIVIAFVLFIYAAPAIADRKERKQAGITAKRPFKSFLADSRGSLAILLALTLLLDAACVFAVIDTDRTLKAQSQAAEVYSGIEAEYLTGDAFTFTDVFAYEGESEESATCFFSAMLLPRGEETVFAPFSFGAADRSAVDAAAADFSSYLLSEEDSYSGAVYPLLGRVRPLDELDPAVIGFYDEMLEANGLEDFRADFYIESSARLTYKDGLMDIIILVVSAILTALLAYAVTTGFLQHNRAKKEAQRLSEHTVDI